MSKDVTAFLVWAAEPHLEAQHKMGFKAIIYLLVLLALVFMSKQKVWSRFGSKKEIEEETFESWSIIHYISSILFSFFIIFLPGR